MQPSHGKKTKKTFKVFILHTKVSIEAFFNSIYEMWLAGKKETVASSPSLSSFCWPPA
jgi:hypothetical protein